MSELDETAGDPVGDVGATTEVGEGADVDGGDPGGHVARQIRAVLRHGLDDTDPVA
jgi:hypothetical protein